MAISVSLTLIVKLFTKTFVPLSVTVGVSRPSKLHTSLRFLNSHPSFTHGVRPLRSWNQSVISLSWSALNFPKMGLCAGMFDHPFFLPQLSQFDQLSQKDHHSRHSVLFPDVPIEFVRLSGKGTCQVSHLHLSSSKRSVRDPCFPVESLPSRIFGMTILPPETDPNSHENQNYGMGATTSLAHYRGVTAQ